MGVRLVNAARRMMPLVLCRYRGKDYYIHLLPLICPPSNTSFPLQSISLFRQYDHGAPRPFHSVRQQTQLCASGCTAHVLNGKAHVEACRIYHQQLSSRLALSS